MSPLELIACLQLALYGAGWAVAAALIAEERVVLAHWSAYALLQALSVLLAPGAMRSGAPNDPAPLIASALGFAAAVRGIDLFGHGRATLDRWLLGPLVLLTGLLLLVPRLGLPAPQTRAFVVATYSFAIASMLLATTPRLWKGLRAGSGRLACAVALSPGVLVGALALLSGLMALVFDAPHDAALRGSVRPANVVASFVLSAIFNFAYLFLLMSRFIGRLRHVARHDHLTGAYTRREIEAVLTAAWHQHQRLGSALAIAVLDIDHFKRINDHHGHAQGDRALVHVARTLAAHTRPYDRVGRWGGEEFLLVMIGADAVGAMQVCERLRAELADASVEAIGMALTISVGIAAARPGDTSVAALLERADRAMYDAKAAGRNRVVLAGTPERAVAGAAA